MRESFKPPAGPMTLERVKTLLKRMPSCTGVCIMGLCEPFLNRETPDIIRWLKDKGGYSLSLTTNGMVDLDQDRLDALFRVDDMVFSIDTADPETFRYLRGGADLKRVIRNLERTLDFKKEKGLRKTDNPPIHINAVITDMNFYQIPDLIRMLEPYSDGVAYLMIDPVTRPDYSPFKPLLQKRNEFDKYVLDYRRIADQSSLKVVGFDWLFKESSGWGRCPLSWTSMFVEPNGDAYFCYDYEYVLGNVFKEDPMKIWNNSKAKHFRRRLLSPDPPVRQCRSCNFARAGWQEGGVYSEQKLNKEDVEVIV
jgi:radical SAM protein with 4Fe4S-binding SPASM domain